MEIIFILVEPAVPENVGSAARAIKTMGFNKLRLVNTKAHLFDEAKWLAHGSNDILENACVYNNFMDAIADVDLIIATTAKIRSVKFDYYTPEQAKHILYVKSDSIDKVAIVFGREESGLKNEELSICDIAVTIPLIQPFPSINLAQSVMIMAYVFSDIERITPSYDNKKNNFTLLKKKAKTILNTLEIKSEENLHGRIMERLSLIKTPDINLFLSLINRFEKIISNK